MERVVTVFTKYFSKNNLPTHTFFSNSEETDKTCLHKNMKMTEQCWFVQSVNSIIYMMLIQILIR